MKKKVWAVRDKGCYETPVKIFPFSVEPMKTEEGEMICYDGNLDEVIPPPTGYLEKYYITMDGRAFYLIFGFNIEEGECHLLDVDSNSIR